MQARLDDLIATSALNIYEYIWHCNACFFEILVWKMSFY